MRYFAGSVLSRIVGRFLTMGHYSQFLDDLNDFYKERRLSGNAKPIGNDEALAVVRDRWLEQGKLVELVSFIHTNWDSGNCDDFIRPLEVHLIDTNQSELFRLMWTKIIKYRLSALWKTLKACRERIDVSEIVAIDTSDFNMFSRESYKDLKKVLAFRRQFVLDGLNKMKDGLIQLNQGTAEINQMIEDISVLKRSKVKL